MITEIKLLNFKSHAKTNIKFEQGINVIVGENGSGKTSILDAISFALFKNKPKDIKLDDLIKLGEKEMKVELLFHQNNKIFRIKRIRRKNGTTESMLYINERPFARSNVDKEIEKVFGMDGNIFSRAIYVKQGEIDALISMEPSKRKIEINKLLGINEIEKAWEAIREIIRDFELRLKSLEGISKEIEEKKRKMEDIKKEMDEQKRELQEKENNLNIIKEKLLEEEKELELLEKIKDIIVEKEKILIEKRNLEEKIKNIEFYEREVEKYKKDYEIYLEIDEKLNNLRNDERNIIIKLKEIEELKKELKKKEEKIKEINKIISSYEEKFKRDLKNNFEKFKKEIENEKRRLREKIDEFKRRRDDILGKIKEISGILIQIEKSKKDLETVKGKCPICRSPIDEKRKEEIIKEYEEEIKNLELRKKVYNRNFEKIDKEIKSLENSLKELEGINTEAIFMYLNRLKELISEKNEILEKISGEKEIKMKFKEINENIKKNEEIIKNLRENYEKYITAQRFLKNIDKNNTIKKLNELNKKIDILKNSFNDFLKVFDEEKLRSIFGKADFINADVSSVDREISFRKRKINILRTEILEYEKKIAHLNAVINKNKRNIEELKNELIILKKKEKEFEKLKYFVSLLKKIRDVFSKDKLQKELRNMFRPIIEKYTKEIFEKFNIEFTDLRITEDFGVEIFTRNGKKKVESLSGGERIALAIALRLAIAKILSRGRITFMMFDEPTIHLDSQRRKILINIIKEMGKFIPQIIVVTHDREFEEAADNLIVLEKINGTSRIVETE